MPAFATRLTAEVILFVLSQSRSRDFSQKLEPRKHVKIVNFVGNGSCDFTKE